MSACANSDTLADFQSLYSNELMVTNCYEIRVFETTASCNSAKENIEKEAVSKLVTIE